MEAVQSISSSIDHLMCRSKDVILPEIEGENRGTEKRSLKDRAIIIKRASKRGRLMISKPLIC